MIITTQTARYEVTDDRSCVTRHPSDEPTGDWPVAQLRRDSEQVPLIAYEEPVIGERWIIVVDVRGDGVSTIRRTTPVVSVRSA